MFTEGYASISAPSGLRTELCREALRLAELLANAGTDAAPTAHALAALFCYQASRLGARLGDDGSLLLLRDQDRTRWNQSLIARGQAHLREAARGSQLSRYHLEAEIASCHALAPDFESTDWPRIAELYDLLEALLPSPMITLNRAVIAAQLDGPDAGLRLLDRVATSLDGTCQYHTLRAELEHRRGDRSAARRHFSRAIALATADPVRRFLTDRLAQAGPDVDSTGPLPS
jgi:RNA polymerase sigma-70 factor (ECF subfamily)